MFNKKPSLMEKETSSQKNANARNQQQEQTSSNNQKGHTTRIKVKYDVGFTNDIYLRGKGANLSWDKGVRLKCTNKDEWIWETNQPFSDCEFKVLINDRVYESGNNHMIHQGETVEFTPHFQEKS